MLKAIRRFLPSDWKIILANRFPRLYARYEKHYILHVLKLKDYYNRNDNALHIGSAVIPLSVISDAALIGTFNSEYADIVYPYVSDNPNVSVADFIEGPYEFGAVTLKKNDVVLDCGANLGLFSIMASGKGCRSYAFEPLPANICLLEKMINENQNIFIAPYALSNNTGTAEFTAATSFSSVASLNEIEHTPQNTVDNHTITVNTITIDQYVQENHLPRVDFIKADIEGAERYMLQGATQTLAEFAPKLSICTYHFPDDPDVLQKIILEANPKYLIEHCYKKLYAHVPQ